MYVCLSLSLSAAVSQKPHIHSVHVAFVHGSSSSVYNAVWYIMHLVLWMTLCFYIMASVRQRKQEI